MDRRAFFALTCGALAAPFLPKREEPDYPFPNPPEPIQVWVRTGEHSMEEMRTFSRENQATYLSTSPPNPQVGDTVEIRAWG